MRLKYSMIVTCIKSLYKMSSMLTHLFIINRLFVINLNGRFYKPTILWLYYNLFLNHVKHQIVNNMMGAKY